MGAGGGGNGHNKNKKGKRHSNTRDVLAVMDDDYWSRPSPGYRWETGRDRKPSKWVR